MWGEVSPGERTSIGERWSHGGRWLQGHFASQGLAEAPVKVAPSQPFAKPRGGGAPAEEGASHGRGSINVSFCLFLTSVSHSSLPGWL